MFKFKINFQHADGAWDFVIIEKETLEEVREEANFEVNKRGAIDYFSEKLA